MDRRRRLVRFAFAALLTLGVATTAGCGATAGTGENVPPSTSPK